jgi:hypothetical protein
VLENQTLAGRWQALSVFPADFVELAATAVWDLRKGGGPDTAAAVDELTALPGRSLVRFDGRTLRYSLHDLVRPAARKAFGYVEGHPLDATTADRLRRGGDSRATTWEYWPRQTGCTPEGTTGCGPAWRSATGRRPTSRPLDLGGGEPGCGPARDRAVPGLPEPGRLHPGAPPGVADAGRVERVRGRGVPRPGRPPGGGEPRGEPGVARGARSCHEQELALAGEVGGPRLESKAMVNLGVVAMHLGDTRTAVTLIEGSLAIARRLGGRRGELSALGNLGIVYKHLGDVNRAIDNYQQALAVARARRPARRGGHARQPRDCVHHRRGLPGGAPPLPPAVCSSAGRPGTGTARGTLTVTWPMHWTAGTTAGGDQPRRTRPGHLRGNRTPSAEQARRQLDEWRGKASPNNPPDLEQTSRRHYSAGSGSEAVTDPTTGPHGDGRPFGGGRVHGFEDDRWIASGGWNTGL